MKRRLLPILGFAVTLCLFALPAYADDYCFCQYPNDSATYGACAGQTFNKATVGTGDTAACTSLCQSQGTGFTAYGPVTDYNSNVCDWQYQGGTCLGVNKTQTSDSCKAAAAGGTNNAKAAAIQAAGAGTRGSPLSLPLPLGNISPQKLIGLVIRGALGMIGTVAFVMFVWGGLRWMIARGNADEVKKAKQTIVWATMGLVVIFAAYAIVSTIIIGLAPALPGAGN